ncbi:Emopamil-binding protein [Eremomyces bilateralis CBS 781.70]|uniref:Emopamil-binding protein n=1 Tax=Eremomyces bilateralis CBS 781.70 TaxID=1392243 RepID=A0A6G1GFQ8_9PEZI|nr:Emopamil-binding protein [Eremomyces bilateralis CBS 781.70]KAF1816690.1 Emopamil-binding protein [Eremomyces bilateralis CBS 781.70]
MEAVEGIVHPYFPVESVLLGYVANDWTVKDIFGVFFGAILAVAVTTRVVSHYINPKLSVRDQWLVVWFILSGTIHIVIEGYFSLNHRNMPPMQDYLGQGWKEYSKGDSRYLTIDPFLVSMETVTAFAWGPLCYIEAWYTLIDHPYRHPVQVLVSTGQFYGDVLYFTTYLGDYLYDGLNYSRPEALYFWGYVVGLNAFWFVIPGYCVYRSMKETARAFSVIKESALKLKQK